MAIIEFIKKKPKTQKGMRSVIKYILNPIKTLDSLCGGYNCDYKNAAEEFNSIKDDYGKTNGIQCIHFIQSFSINDNITPDIAKQIADRLVQFPQFQGFQIVYATHIDKEHLHTHYILNSVNSETGRKWHQTSSQLQELKDYSDKICLEFGLSIIDEKQKTKGHKSSGEYRTSKDGKSYKYELFLAVVNCMRRAISRDDFISYMQQLGYSVDWNDNKKYITFTMPNGKKCRNKKLYPPEKFTKEALEKTFAQNLEKQDILKSKQSMDILIKLVNILRQQNDNPLLPLSSLINGDLEGKVLKEFWYNYDVDSSLYNENLKGYLSAEDEWEQ